MRPSSLWSSPHPAVEPLAPAAKVSIDILKLTIWTRTVNSIGTAVVRHAASIAVKSWAAIHGVAQARARVGRGVGVVADQVRASRSFWRRWAVHPSVIDRWVRAGRGPQDRWVRRGLGHAQGWAH